MGELQEEGGLAILCGGPTHNKKRNNVVSVFITPSKGFKVVLYTSSKNMLHLLTVKAIGDH